MDMWDVTAEQIEAMLRQEVTAYRCEDYLIETPSGGRVPRRRSMLDCPAHVRRAAIEELGSFVASLSIGETDAAWGDSEGRAADDSTKEVPTVAMHHRSPSSAMVALEHLMPDLHAMSDRRGSEEDGGLARWRWEMANWCYEVSDAFGFDKEAVAVAFSSLDRYLASAARDRRIGRDGLQLLCAAALYTAIKVTDPSRKPSVEAFVSMSRGVYTEECIASAEMDMLTVLEWRVNPPTPLAFVRLLLDLHPEAMPPETKREMFLRCRELTEIAVGDPAFVSCRPSLVAVASILIAFAMEEEDGPEDAGVQSASPPDINKFLTNVENFTDIELRSAEVLICTRHLEQLYLGDS